MDIKINIEYELLVIFYFLCFALDLLACRSHLHDLINGDSSDSVIKDNRMHVAAS